MSGLKLSGLSDADLARKYQELAYRRVEVALDPDHPASRANGARWARELKLVERACERRGLFQDQQKEQT